MNPNWPSPRVWGIFSAGVVFWTAWRIWRIHHVRGWFDGKLHSEPWVPVRRSLRDIIASCSGSAHGLRSILTSRFSAWFRDGRAPSLEEQALLPIQAADEMNQDIDGLVTELSADRPNRPALSDSRYYRIGAGYSDPGSGRDRCGSDVPVPDARVARRRADRSLRALTAPSRRSRRWSDSTSAPRRASHLADSPSISSR